MKYYSTNHKSENTSFKNAVLQSMAGDKGLYFPERIPALSNTFYERLPGMSLSEIGFHFLKPYVDGALPDGELKDIMEDVFSFDIPLVEVEPDKFALELFHGPTLAFKDVGARTLARFLSKFSATRRTTILVATSGDTGSAVAHGFFDMPNIDVVVLYPKDKVSKLQEKQFTTLGRNIMALEVNGTFDDCQRMVKAAFIDGELKKRMLLSSANSINIARLLPQAIYYFYAYGQLKSREKPVVISVPTGNLGNLTAGLLAKKSGLPVAFFVASGNRNNVFQQYLETGIFRPRPSVPTLSNAMDVGDPSNLVRIQELYNHSFAVAERDIKPYHFSDEQTRRAIADIYKQTHYILDPHGAVAYLGLSSYMNEKNITGIFLETAHPAKFYKTVEQEIPVKVKIPQRLAKSLHLPKQSVEIGNRPEDLKRFLLER
ncbi:Threonine synthase [hydrothermal vent metagenome]|uniref:Threonine synthase n=1 Tax=hydrothermal vent metagenome TaxID=652676 RepID=A0A3B0UIN4_9ZZZZ